MVPTEKCQNGPDLRLDFHDFAVFGKIMKMAKFRVFSLFSAFSLNPGPRHKPRDSRVFLIKQWFLLENTEINGYGPTEKGLFTEKHGNKRLFLSKKC